MPPSPDNPGITRAEPPERSPAETLAELLRGFGRGTVPHGCLLATLPGSALLEVTAMRRFLELFLAHRHLEADDYLLLLSAHELLTNAVLHGEEPVTLLVADEQPGSVVAVLDHGAPLELSVSPYHGLAILDRASNGRVGVLPTAHGKWVSVHLPAA